MAQKEFLMNQQFEQAKLMEEAQKWKNEIQMSNLYNEANVSK